MRGIVRGLIGLLMAGAAGAQPATAAGEQVTIRDLVFTVIDLDGEVQDLQVKQNQPPKAKVHEGTTCCSVTAINQATGVVTLTDLKTGAVYRVTVTDKARLKSLKIGQQVDRNF